MTVPMKTQKRPPNPPLRSPMLSDLFNMSNTETEERNIEFDRIHQDKLPSSHIYGNEAQGRDKTKVSLVSRSSVRSIWREDEVYRTLNSCFLPKRLISDKSLAVSPWTFPKASTKREDGPVSGLEFWVGTAKSFLMSESAIFWDAMMLSNVWIQRDKQ